MMQVFHVRGILVRIAHTEPSRLKYPQDYVLMAEVPYDENEDVEFNLEKAYRLTNSITDAWYTNPALTIHREGRSTSVGDIVVTPNGNVWRLTYKGFKFVENAETSQKKAQDYKRKQAEIEGKLVRLNE